MKFDDLVHQIERHRPFAFARYGDGEWNCILGVQGKNCDGHSYFADMRDALVGVLTARPTYVLGMQNLARQRMGAQIDGFLKSHKLTDLAWSNADIIHHANIRGEAGRLWSALAERTVILVGPNYLRAQTTVPYARFVEIPSTNCWRAKKEVMAELFVHLSELRNVVVLFCASMATNVWVDECFKLWREHHTFIDLGSALDPYAGKSTRTYHKKMNVKGASVVSKASDIQGWFNFEWVYDGQVKRATNGATFVEVGVWKGRSVAHLAQCIRASKKKIRLFAVDTFEGSPTEKQHQDDIRKLTTSLLDVFLANMEALGLRGLVTPVKMTSVEAAKQFDDGSLDFVFIDADHRYASVAADIDAWLPKVKQDGFIGGHDVEKAPGVARAVEERFGTLPHIHKNSWIVCKKVAPVAALSNGAGI